MRTRKWSVFLVFNLMVAVGTALVLIYFATRPNQEATNTELPAGATQSTTASGNAPEAQIPPPPTPAPPSPIVYVVQQGDTLGAIAQEYGVTVEEIMVLNSLDDPNVLHIGQELTIPTPAPSEDQDADTPPAQGDLPTPLPSPTPIGPAIVEIAQVLGSGNLDAEIVIVRNRGGEASLEGWTLSNEKDSVYTLPNLTLFPGGQVTIHSRSGKDGPTDLYWGRVQAAWSAGELLQLRDHTGAVVDSYIVP